MVIGYVFLRNSNDEMAIINNKPPNKDDFNKKLFKLLSCHLFDLGDKQHEK